MRTCYELHSKFKWETPKLADSKPPAFLVKDAGDSCQIQKAPLLVAYDVAQAQLHNEVESLWKQLAEQQQQQQQQQPEIVSTSRDIPVDAHAQVINTRQSSCNIL